MVQIERKTKAAAMWKWAMDGERRTFTAQEACEAIGLAYPSARFYIREWYKAGMLYQVGNDSVRNVPGPRPERWRIKAGSKRPPTWQTPG